MAYQKEYPKAEPTAMGLLFVSIEIAKLLRSYDADTQRWIWAKAQQILYEDPQSSNSGGKY